MKNRSNEPIRLQQSIFYPREERAIGLFDSHYVHMFLEDLRLAFMPIGGSSKKRPFKIELTPPDQGRARQITSILAERTYGRSLAESLCKFLPLVAVEVCAERRATYEIVYFEDPVTKQLIDFDLAFVPEEQLLRQNGRLYQIVPSEIARERGVATLITLPWENIICFEAPLNLAPAIDRAMDTLPRLSGFQLGDLVHAAQENQLPYDFSIHQNSLSLALAEACKDIGWTGRGELYGKVLSYYWIRQDLIFKRFMAELRTEFVRTLNEGLSRIARRLNFEAQIVVLGLPTTGGN